MAYYDVDIAAITSKLLGAESSSVWWSEGTVGKNIGLKSTPMKGVREVLTRVLNSISKGYAGGKKDGYRTGHVMANLYDENNGTKVRVTQHGRAVSFEGGTLSDDTSKNKPRYFAFGNPRFTINDQMSIDLAIVGRDDSLVATARKRREDNWRKWFRGERDDGGYGRFDVPAIVHGMASWCQLPHSTSYPPLLGLILTTRRRLFMPIWMKRMLMKMEMMKMMTIMEKYWKKRREAMMMILEIERVRYYDITKFTTYCVCCT